MPQEIFAIYPRNSDDTFADLIKLIRKTMPTHTVREFAIWREGSKEVIKQIDKTNPPIILFCFDKWSNMRHEEFFWDELIPKAHNVGYIFALTSQEQEKQFDFITTSHDMRRKLAYTEAKLLTILVTEPSLTAVQQTTLKELCESKFSENSLSKLGIEQSVEQTSSSTCRLS